MTNYQIDESKKYNQTARNYFSKMENVMDKYAIAEMVVSLREFVDYFEQKKDLTDSEQEILMMGCEALRLPTQEIHFLANEIEGD